MTFAVGSLSSEETILWTNRMFFIAFCTSGSMRDICRVFNGHSFSIRCQIGWNVDFSINMCTQQSCAVYCKVLVSRVEATKLLSGFVTTAE
jgi:hypothetical protein